MRKLTYFGGAMLVAALATISGLSTPKPAWAFCYCDTYNDWETAVYWGMGSSCTAAQNDLASQANQEAYAFCGRPIDTCLGTLVITGPCHPDHGTLVVDGYREFSCRVCI